jgi:hypothetical protein
LPFFGQYQPWLGSMSFLGFKIIRSWSISTST